VRPFWGDRLVPINYKRPNINDCLVPINYKRPNINEYLAPINYGSYKVKSKARKKTSKNKKSKKNYVKPACTSEESFGSLILGCSFTDCGINSAFK